MRFYLRTLSYFRPDLSRIIRLLVVIGVSTLLGLLQVWPLAILVDSVMSQAPQDDAIHRTVLSLLPKSRVGQVVGLAAAALGLRLLLELLNLARTMVTHRINYNGLMRVRCDLFSKLQQLSLAYHKSQPQGDALYRLSSDTAGCSSILHVLIATVVAAVTLAAMIVIMLSRSVSLTLVALSVAGPLIAANFWFGRTFKSRAIEAKKVESEFTTVLQRSLSSIGLVQAFGREADELEHFRGTVHSSTRAWFRLHRQEVLYSLIVGTIFGLGGTLIFGYGGYLVCENQLGLGDLMVIMAYLGMIYDPLCKLTGAGVNLQGGAVSMERVFEVLDRDVGIVDAPDAVDLPRQPRILGLDDVIFEYVPGRPVLRGLNVTIASGQMVAFVGPSGVGKSTVLNLLPRFYDPTAGAVTLDGLDGRHIKLKDLRRHVALVLQDSILLPTTIAENIAYGRPTATLEEIQQAAEMAGIHSFIDSLPDQYETEVSEQGQNLSGGQRQRIAIARALLTEAPIIVLDEPTSSLDPEHERLIAGTLESLKGKRTIVVVSHRLNTVKGCDQILVMEAGRVIERGTHEELLQREGAYARMAVLQLGRETPTPPPSPRRPKPPTSCFASVPVIDPRPVAALPCSRMALACGDTNRRLKPCGYRITTAG